MSLRWKDDPDTGGSVSTDGRFEVNVMRSFSGGEQQVEYFLSVSPLRKVREVTELVQARHTEESAAAAPGEFVAKGHVVKDDDGRVVMVEQTTVEVVKDATPSPADSLDEAKALARAIDSGDRKAIHAFEADRKRRRAEARAERQAAGRREQFASLVADPDIAAMIRELAKGAG
jgi:hypothetical protein